MGTILGITNALGLNDLLCSEVLSHASSFHLPTFIAGDFNHALLDAPVWSHYRAAGFVDLASKFATIAGEVPDPTYRGKSRLDYILANEAAEALCTAWHVDPRGYTDHASLHLRISLPRCSPYKLRWSMPYDMASVPQVLNRLRDYEIPQQQTHDFCQHLACGSIDMAFQDFCKTFEEACCHVHADVGLGTLPDKLRGRGKGKLQKVPVAPLSLSLAGDLLTDQVAFRSRQKLVRQIRELLWALRKTDGQLRPLHFMMWTKLVRSKACPGGFTNWVLNNDLAPWVPEAPCLLWMEHFLDAVLLEEAGWARNIKAKQNLVRKDAMEEDWSNGGRLHAASLKPASAPPLAALARHDPIKIEPLRVPKGANAKFRMVSGPSPDPGNVWMFGSFKVRVASAHGGEVTMMKPFTSEMWRREATQLCWTSDPQYMASCVMQYWSSFWNAERSPDLEFMTQNLVHLPELLCFEAEISPAELDYVLQRLPARKSRGMEGFSYAELKSLGPQLRSMLLSLLNAVTLTGRWPKQLCMAVVSLLAKTDQPMGPADARPIVVLSSIYRVWSKCITVKVLKHLLPVLPSTLFGSAPGRSAMDIAWLLQGRLEEAALSGGRISGVSMDLSKAFNLIPREPLDLICQRLGWPATVRNAYQSFLGDLQRFFGWVTPSMGLSFHGLAFLKAIPLLSQL